MTMEERNYIYNCKLVNDLLARACVQIDLDKDVEVVNGVDSCTMEIYSSLKSFRDFLKEFPSIEICSAEYDATTKELTIYD